MENLSEKTRQKERCQTLLMAWVGRMLETGGYRSAGELRKAILGVTGTGSAGRPQAG